MELSDWRKYVEEETKKIKTTKEDGARTSEKSVFPATEISHKEDSKSIKSTIILGPSSEVKRDIEEAGQESKTAGAQTAVAEPKPPVSSVPKEKVGAEGEEQKKTKVGLPAGLGTKTTTVREVWAQAEREKSHQKPEAEPPAPPELEETTAINEQAQLFIPDFGAPKKPYSQPESRIRGKEEGRNEKELARQELLNKLLDPTLTLEETALILNMCKATVRRYTNKGVLPHYRTPGNQRRFRLSDVLEFMKNFQKK